MQGPCSETRASVTGLPALDFAPVTHRAWHFPLAAWEFPLSLTLARPEIPAQRGVSVWLAVAWPLPSNTGESEM
jgi:hypothetical protein